MDKAGIAVPSKDKLPGVVDTLISAVRAGELDDMFAQASKQLLIAPQPTWRCYNWLGGDAAALFVYGHSLAPNDDHVLRFIEKGKVGRLYVSLYGERDTPANCAIIARAERMSAVRDRFPLEVAFFGAQDAAVWGSH